MLLRNFKNWQSAKIWRYTVFSHPCSWTLQFLALPITGNVRYGSQKSSCFSVKQRSCNGKFAFRFRARFILHIPVLIFAAWAKLFFARATVKKTVKRTFYVRKAGARKLLISKAPYFSTSTMGKLSSDNLEAVTKRRNKSKLARYFKLFAKVPKLHNR